MNADSMPVTQSEDMRKSREWTARFSSCAAALPISFRFDGRFVTGIPAEWRPTSSRRRIDANIIETILEGRDPGTGLSVRVEFTEYQDYPVVEWVAWFANEGHAATPVLSDILALDAAFSGVSPVVYQCNGDFCSADGYTARETPLGPGAALKLAPNGGFPCDGAFPYHRVRFDGCGFTLATGWPGQWSASFDGVSGGIHVRAGQEKTHLRLMPGERIRTPRMTVLAWMGDTTRGVNLWRRWYRAHILPRPDGQPMKPLLACCCPGDGEEFTAATEEGQLRGIAQFEKRGIGFDVWWIDAGWYPCRNEKGESQWWRTGTWEPDPERFPRGLMPVSERAVAAGGDLLAWFDPERVQPGTRLARERPEWLRRITVPNANKPWSNHDNAQMNLGNPECRQWLTDHVCRLIRENGIKIYRQDCNFWPLEYWRVNEPADRQGIYENLHVQGYLQYWDDLLARNPGLWIDSCASGGRRNDLETMRRSAPLHCTDFGYGDPPVKLDFHRTIYEWFPYFKDVTLAWDRGVQDRFDSGCDTYAYHCALAPMLTPALDIRREDYDYVLAGKMIELWRRVAGMVLTGDYYPHSPSRRDGRGWVAWQFDCPESGCGLVQGIRFPATEEESIVVRLKAVSPDASYHFENGETGESMNIPCDRLARDGFRLALAPRTGVIWLYRKMAVEG